MIGCIVVFMLLLGAGSGIAYLSAVMLPPTVSTIISGGGGVLFTLYLAWWVLAAQGPKGNYIPFFGLRWLRDAAQRQRNAELAQLETAARNTVKRQVAAATRTKVALERRTKKGREYLETLNNYIDGVFVSMDGMVYSHFGDAPVADWHEKLTSAGFKQNALLSIKKPTWLYAATKNEFTRSAGEFFIVTNIYGIVESGIPELVLFNDAYAALREVKAQDRALSPLAFVIGRGHQLADSKLEWIICDPISDTPGVLVAGPTGKGKTNTGINMILMWCLENTAPELRLKLVDLKRNVYPLYFENLPHVDGEIAQTLVEGMASLQSMVHERERRSELFAKHKRRSIAEWNAKPPRGQAALPYVMWCCDEIQLFMLNLGKAEKELYLNWSVDVASLGREVGLGLAIFTQYPRSDVLERRVTVNIENRVAFRMDGTASNMVLDNHNAEKLLEDIAGRALFKRAGGTFKMQAPLHIESAKGWNKCATAEKKARNTAAILATVEEIRIKAGQLDRRTIAVYDAVTARAEWLLPSNGDGEDVKIYKMPVNDLRDELSGQYGFGGKGAVSNYLKALDSQEFEWHDTTVTVLPPVGSTPRCLKIVPRSTFHADSTLTPPVGAESAGGAGNGDKREREVAENLVSLADVATRWEK